MPLTCRRVVEAPCRVGAQLTVLLKDGVSASTPATVLPALGLCGIDENAIVFLAPEVTTDAPAAHDGGDDDAAGGRCDVLGWAVITTATTPSPPRPVFVVTTAAVRVGEVWASPVLFFNLLSGCVVDTACADDDAAIAVDIRFPSDGGDDVSDDDVDAGGGSARGSTHGIDVGSAAAAATGSLLSSTAPPDVVVASRLVLSECEVDPTFPCGSDAVDASLRHYFSVPRLVSPGDVHCVPVLPHLTAHGPWQPVHNDAFGYSTTVAARAIAVRVDAVEAPWPKK